MGKQKPHSLFERLSEFVFRKLNANAGAPASLVLGVLLIAFGTNWTAFYTKPWPFLSNVRGDCQVGLVLVALGIAGLLSSIFPYRTLRVLWKFHKRGILTEKEFQTEKQRILGASHEDGSEDVQDFLNWASGNKPKCGAQAIEELRGLVPEWVKSKYV